MAKKFIGVCVGQYQIFLNDAREVYGHDDSLPYNAEFEIKKNGIVLFSGKAWNDGWGGMSSFSIEDVENRGKHQKVIDKIDEYGKKHLTYEPKFYKGHVFDMGFIDIIDMLAILSVSDDSPNLNKLFAERAFLNYMREH